LVNIKSDVKRMHNTGTMDTDDAVKVAIAVYDAEQVINRQRLAKRVEQQALDAATRRSERDDGRRQLRSRGQPGLDVPFEEMAFAGPEDILNFALGAIDRLVSDVLIGKIGFLGADKQLDNIETQAGHLFEAGKITVIDEVMIKERVDGAKQTLKKEHVDELTQFPDFSEMQANEIFDAMREFILDLFQSAVDKKQDYPTAINEIGAVQFDAQRLAREGKITGSEEHTIRNLGAMTRRNLMEVEQREKDDQENRRAGRGMLGPVLVPPNTRESFEHMGRPRFEEGMEASEFLDVILEFIDNLVGSTLSGKQDMATAKNEIRSINEDARKMGTSGKLDQDEARIVIMASSNALMTLDRDILRKENEKDKIRGRERFEEMEASELTSTIITLIQDLIQSVTGGKQDNFDADQEIRGLANDVEDMRNRGRVSQEESDTVKREAKRALEALHVMREDERIDSMGLRRPKFEEMHGSELTDSVIEFIGSIMEAVMGDKQDTQTARREISGLNRDSNDRVRASKESEEEGNKISHEAFQALRLLDQRMIDEIVENDRNTPRGPRPGFEEGKKKPNPVVILR